MSLQRITGNVWKIHADSNAYFLDYSAKIMIDTGNRTHRALLLDSLTKRIAPEAIEIVIFTHLHFDHIGNFDLFPNATFYASEQEIENFRRDAQGTVLHRALSERFKTVELKAAHDMHGLTMIETPGHTSGSLCIWYPQARILFSGDTLFRDGTGRTDLPTSMPQEMPSSLCKLRKLDYEVLCPGHDY